MTNRNGTTITWNSDNMPTTITQNGSNSSSFSYAPDKHRYYQTAMIAGVSETTVYVGAYEAVTTGGITKYRHHLMADGREVAEVDLSNTGSSVIEKISYILSDHLGSVDVVQTTKPDGTLISTTDMSFSAWGNRREPSSWSGSLSTAEVAADHGANRYGFTHQEMLDNVALIHMNGRVYDPNLGRFLSVDPVFEFPTNTQSLNPYSYVLNNPLSLTDPTGYAWSFCITGSDHDGCMGGSGSSGRDSKGNLFTKDAQQIVDMKNGTTKTVGSFLVSKDSEGNVAIANGSQNSQNSNDGQNKPTDVAGIGSTQQVSKTPPSSVDVTATDLQSRGLNNVQDLGEKMLPVSDRNPQGGYKTATEAALGQFHAYEPEYKASVKGNYELTGLIYGKGDTNVFSVMIRTPTPFRGTFDAPSGYGITAFTHTHSDGSTFGGLDWIVPGDLGKGVVQSFMKNSNDKAYRWDPSGAHRYGMSLGWMPGENPYNYVGGQNVDFKWGISPICAGDSSCAH